MTHPRKRMLWTFAPLVLVACALFAPGLIQGKALFWGTPMLQFIPWWDWAWGELANGHLPLWNPNLGMGAPLLANYQSALFYPPNWALMILHLLGGVRWLAWGQGLSIALHLVWAGAGMALLIQRLGLNRLAQVVGSLAFSFSGYLVARAGFLSINATAAWLPWVLFAATSRKKTSGGRGSSFGLLILSLSAQLLAGHAQTFWYSTLLAFIWVGYHGWWIAHSHLPEESPSSNPNQILQNIKRLAIELISAWKRLTFALLLAVCITAVQLLPTVEYLTQSQRSGAVDFEVAMTYSFWPWRLLTLAAPDLFGSPVRGDYWGYGNYWEDANYLGMLPLLLSISAIISGFRRKPTRGTPGLGADLQEANAHLARFLFVVILVAVLLALGKNTPVFPWLYRNIPTFDMFQAPTRIMIWAVFGLALLGAIGVNGWQRPEKRALYWTRLSTAGSGAVTIGAGLAWYSMGDISPTFIRATALAGFWGIGVGVLSLLAPPSRESLEYAVTEEKRMLLLPGNLWRILVIVWVSLDLFLASWGLNPVIDAEYYLPAPVGTQLLGKLDSHRLFIDPQDEYDLKFKRFLRFDSFDPGEDWGNFRHSLLPNQALLDNISSVNNFDPLIPGRFASWMEGIEAMPSSKRTSLLNLMDVGVLEKLNIHAPSGISFDIIDGSERIRWTPCAVIVADSQSAWEKVFAEEIDFNRLVVLENEVASEEEIRCAQESSDLGVKIELATETPNRLVIMVETQNPGWVVISDTWYPGWKAYVDGRPADLLRANYLFRAVAVHSGTHEVEIVYRPISFWSGLCLSLATLLAMAIVVVRQHRMERRSDF